MLIIAYLITVLNVVLASNIRSTNKPNVHARITVENFNGQHLNPSSVNFNLFTDDRGEEKAIFAFRAGQDSTQKDTLRLTNFDREIIKFVRENDNTPERLKHIQERQRILKMTPIALDTSANDHDTNEGSIGTFADRSIQDVKASAELHDIQQAPYVDEDSRGVILAKSMIVPGQLHVTGGRFLIVESSDVFVGYAPDKIKQFKLVIDETYDQDSVVGWTAYSKNGITENNKRGRCGINITPRTDWFLGPYASAEVTKTFTLPSDHTRFKLSANFHFIDEWSDETAYLKINNKIVWQQGHTMCGSLSVLPEFAHVCQRKGVNACGGKGVDQLGVLINYQSEYFSNEIVLTFGATLEKGNDATWGVDDLQISVY